MAGNKESSAVGAELSVEYIVGDISLRQFLR